MGTLKNQRHEQFCRLIVKGTPVTAAYELAGFKPHHNNPYRLRENEAVAARIRELRAQLFRKQDPALIADVERLTREFSAIAAADITALMQIVDGQVIVNNTADLPRELTAAIAEIRQTKDGIVIKMHNKTEALQNLAKHMGYYKENVQLNVTLTLADLVNMSYQADLPPLPDPKVIEHESGES